ncbi:GGDEF domain-containing protein [Leptolyngbya sp. 'hensonii']|uniref:GGDEF domain-containing protein n=1 Tax=Leptolyngbya sp. 'hensonii' TaxID=1922337 RepID=UPI000B048EF5|nr:GGDEF domain-containing protein [Leptolyngbya sp. 'hensonii']
MEFQTFQVRLLKLIVGLSLLVIPLMWACEVWILKYVNPIDRLAYPILLTVCSGTLLMVQINRRRYHLAALSNVIAFVAYAVIYLQAIIYGYEPVRDSYNIAGFAQWFPLVYTVAFMFLRKQQAIVVSILIYLSILLPNLFKVLLIPIAEIPTVLQTDHAFPFLVQMVCSHPIYIAALLGISTLQESFVQVKAEADVMSIAANVDYLTEIANRRATSQILQQILTQKRKTERSVAVILLDIDRFKHINDTFGHDVGDQVLITVASRLKKYLRSNDTLGRWGGEEFLIVLVDTTALEVTQLAERLRLVIAEQSFPLVGKVTASFGIALSLPDDTLELLVKRADEALYRAKAQGRDQIVVAT